MTIKIIFFDMWCTLAWNFKDSHLAGIRKKYGLKKSQLNGSMFWEWHDSTSAKMRTNDITPYLQILRKRLKLPEEADEDFRKMWKILKFDTHNVKGMPQLIRKLSKKHRVGIISGTGDEIYYSLKRAKILKFFNPIITSFETGQRKNKVKIFQLALKKAKVKGSEAIMIGDDYKTDVVQAKKAGMHAILFKDAKQLEKELKRYRF